MDSIIEKEVNVMDRMIVGFVVLCVSLVVMMYILMLIVVFIFKRVRFMVDKVFFRLFFDSRVR